MFFQVLTRTTIKIIAPTIQVQIIEFVTGSPKKWKITGAADGTASSAEAVEFAGVEIAPVEPSAAGCAFRFATKIAAKIAQTRKTLLNGFTVKIASDDTDCPIKQTNYGFENFKAVTS
jgi:hypothetical protein